MRPKVSFLYLVLVLTSALRAQEPLRSLASPLLGERAVEVETGAAQARGSSDPTLGVATSVNLPVWSHLDVGGGYAFSHLRGSTGAANGFSVAQNTHTVFATASAYLSLQGFKPCLTAGMGRESQTTKVTFNGTNVFSETDAVGMWVTALGIEIPLGRVTLSPRISYQDYLKRDYFHDRVGGVGYETAAHLRITQSAGVFASVAFFDSNEGRYSRWRFQAWRTLLGVRRRF